MISVYRSSLERSVSFEPRAGRVSPRQDHGRERYIPKQNSKRRAPRPCRFTTYRHRFARAAPAPRGGRASPVNPRPRVTRADGRAQRLTPRARPSAHASIPGPRAPRPRRGTQKHHPPSHRSITRANIIF